MKKITVTTALFLAALSGAQAADYSGAWHSIDDRSSWSDGKFPKGFSLTINLKFEGDKLIYHSVNDTNKSAPAVLDYVATLDGTVAPVLNNARFNQVSIKRLGPNELQLLELKDGDVIVGSFWTFLPDGKTVVRRGVGKSPEGKSKAFEEYFSRG